jgi:hypothetical protein
MPTSLPTRAPTFTSPPTTLAPTFQNGYIVTAVITFPGLSADDIQDPDFQDALTSSIAAEAGIDESLVTIWVSRRSTSVRVDISSPDAASAASTTSAISSAVSSGTLESTLSTTLASTSYSGSTDFSHEVVTFSTASTASTSSSSGGGGGVTSEGWFIGLLVVLGVLLLAGIVAGFVFRFKRRQRGQESRVMRENKNATGVETVPMRYAEHAEIEMDSPQSPLRQPIHDDKLAMKDDDFNGEASGLHVGLNTEGVEIHEGSSLAFKGDEGPTYDLRTSYDQPHTEPGVEITSSPRGNEERV